MRVSALNLDFAAAAVLHKLAEFKFKFWRSSFFNFHITMTAFEQHVALFIKDIWTTNAYLHKAHDHFHNESPLCRQHLKSCFRE